MPRKVPVTDEQLDWLRQAVEDNTPVSEMARALGVCTDTLKRILTKHKIKTFEAAKYIPSSLHPTTKKLRKCLCCREEKLLPTHIWICEPCKRSNESIHSPSMRLAF